MNCNLYRTTLQYYGIKLYITLLSALTSTAVSFSTEFHSMCILDRTEPTVHKALEHNVNCTVGRPNAVGRMTQVLLTARNNKLKKNYRRLGVDVCTAVLATVCYYKNKFIRVSI